MKTLLFLVTMLFVAVPASAVDLEGWVYGADGMPLDGVTVTAHVVESSADQFQRYEKRLPRPSIATATTSEGRFAFTGLPDSVVDLHVRAEKHAPIAVRVVPGAIPVSITLRAASTVEGKVVARGKAVPDAYVVWTGQNDVEIAAATDANGRYRIPDPRMWAQEPRVFHPVFALRGSRYGLDSLQLDVEPRVPAASAKPAGGGSISGVVRVGRKPLAGAPVIIQGMGEDVIAPIRVVTDAKGQYQAGGLTPRRYAVVIGEGLAPRIRVPHQQMTMDGGDVFAVDLQNQRSATADIQLVAAPVIAGRVVDAEGQPVSGAHVQVILEARSTLDFAHEPFARTSADGRYALAAPPFEATETAMVAVMSRNRATVRSKPFVLGTGDQKIDVTLPRFERVTVRVLDPERKPVPAARVAFASAEETAAFRETATLLLPMFESRATKTNDAGEVVLELTRDTYDFAAVATGFQARSVAGITVNGERTVDLALEEAHEIRGRVHRKGVGVANVQVMLRAERQRREGPVVTGVDGTFVVGGLARGRYSVALIKHDEMINRVIDAEAPSTLDVDLPPAGTLRARVVDAATREPVREFVYSVEPLDAREEDPRQGRAMLQRGESAGDGTFTVTVSAGMYRVTAMATGYTAAQPLDVRVSEAKPADVELALGRGVTLTGRVVDDAGTPVAGADVIAYAADLERLASRSSMRVAPGQTKSGADGSFTISGLEPGEVMVTGRKEGYVPFRKAIDPETASPLDVTLSRGLTLEGMVTRGGKPVPEVQIGATTAAMGGDHQPATTDQNGRFVLRGLIAARYTVSAYKDEMNAEVRDVDPTKQKELVIALDAKVRGVIQGVVTGLPATLGGKIVRRAVFAQSDDHGAEGIIDETGNYRIENAPTGNVWVTAQIESPSGSRSSMRKRVEVPPGQTVRVDLDLSGSVTIGGRVTQDGRPLAGARVVLANEAGLAGSATSRQDGGYDLSIAAPGTYQIYAHADGTSGQFQTIREIRGGETVDIDFREHVLEGSVVDAATREPIAGAMVTLAPETPGFQSYAGEAITDANGRYRILTSASGAHRIVAWAQGYAHKTQPMTLGTSRPAPASFELSKTGALRVTVRDGGTGTPLDAHLVVETATGASLPVRAQRTGDGGTFTFSLEPGKYRITAVVHGYKEKKVEAVAPGSVDIGME